MPGVQDVDVVLGSGGSAARLEHAGLVLVSRRTRTRVPYAHVRAVLVEPSRDVCITLHDGTQYRTPEDNAAALTAFAEGLRRRVAAAGTPGPATPAVSVETVPAWRPDVSGRRMRMILCLVPYFAILITLGVTAGGGHTVELILAGCLSLLSFLSLSFFSDTMRDRYHLRKRGVTVRVPIRSGRVSNRRYRVSSQRFTTVDGRTVTAGVPLHAPQTTTAGDLVDLRYDPQAPETRVRIGDERGQLYGTLPIALIFGILLALPVVIAVAKAIAEILR